MIVRLFVVVLLIVLATVTAALAMAQPRASPVGLANWTAFALRAPVQFAPGAGRRAQAAAASGDRCSVPAASTPT